MGAAGGPPTRLLACGLQPSACFRAHNPHRRTIPISAIVSDRPRRCPALTLKARPALPLLSRRQVVATLLAAAGLLLRGRGTRADHEYVAIVTNTQLGPDGVPGMVGASLVIHERPASPQYLEGCHGVLMPAFHVWVTRDDGRHQYLLVGIDSSYHPDRSEPTPLHPGDRFVVRKSGSGDCDDGTSLLYLLPASVS